MDRRSTKSLWRDYGVPMQDPEAFSLNYNKDTSRDPRKGLLKKKSKTKKVDYTDHTGMLKIDQPPVKKRDGGIIPPKANAPSNVKERYDVSVRHPDSVIQQVPKKFLFMIGDKKVFGVDDNYVKVNLYPDFVEGGNEEAYPEFIPKGEIWVDGEKSPDNQQAIALHEFTEEQLMENKGLKYEKAHPKANKKEMKFRKTFGTFSGLMKKGGKVGNPKDRKKPGGSNVGKYSKSEGPFAGPSGGAPKGSYPIGSKARGKSALKLAHNAPNPAGIKAAVYRKYPELKTKKAMEGAKLGLSGMGEMQHKAASGPTKYNQPPDKVKGNFALYKRKKEARKFNRPPLPH